MFSHTSLLFVVAVSAPGVQLPAKREGVPSGHQAVLTQPEVPPGNAPTPLPHPCGATFLPHRNAAPQNCVRSDQTLLLFIGM